MASAKKSSKLSGSLAKRKSELFLLCVRNDDYPASLEVRKLYATLRDPKAEKLDLVRVVDESGTDYLYPAEYFVGVRLPQSVKKALAKAS
jgi:hypothetical protein